MAQIFEKREIILAPSLLSADWWRVREQVEELTEAGCEWLHFDAMDGHFVPNLTLGPIFLKALRPHSKLHFDAHLMIENPGDLLDEFIDAGADSVSVHVEGNPHLHRLISRIKEKGAMAGAVLNPATPMRALDLYVLDILDYVLVMSVNPGFSGQKFLGDLVLAKIHELRTIARKQWLGFAHSSGRRTQSSNRAGRGADGRGCVGLRLQFAFNKASVTAKCRGFARGDKQLTTIVLLPAGMEVNYVNGRQDVGDDGAEDDREVAARHHDVERGLPQRHRRTFRFGQETH